MIKRMLVTDAPTMERSVAPSSNTPANTPAAASSSRPSSIKSDRDRRMS
jgi:hypothetical protein